MTYGEMSRSFAELKARGEGLGPEMIEEKGLEPLFIRLAMALEAYADGWIDAGGGVEALEARTMGEGFMVEFNHLRQQLES